MNLLEERWIPVRRASGLARIAPHEIADRADPVIALAAPRPDFNGALIQFLIGLVQTAWVWAGEWWDRDAMLAEPPPPERLQALFAPLREAFELDGDGPRFMQDLTLGAADRPTLNDVSALLIDYPGESGAEHNTDLFVKCESGGPMCVPCAATALFCLMTNAPEGGRGHYTSLRGNGPLTTLVAFTPATVDLPGGELWRNVACNVLPAESFATPSGERTLNRVFPWLQPLAKTRNHAGEVWPLDVHPLQIYWAMPRRIRLDFDGEDEKTCSICHGRCSKTVDRYHNKANGLAYRGEWRHRLSPHYRPKGEETLLPEHPRADGLSYRHWLGWALGGGGKGRRVVPAAVVEELLKTRLDEDQVRLHAFGYHMDHMKPCCWYETTFPLFSMQLAAAGADAIGILARIVERASNAADSAALSLRYAVQEAWLGDATSRGDLSFVQAAFWNRTEQGFFDLVEHVVALTQREGEAAFDLSKPLLHDWLQLLRRAGLRLFDEMAASSSVEAGRPARLAAAHRKLRQQLYGDRLEIALGLRAAGAPAEKASRKKSKPKERK